MKANDKVECRTPTRGSQSKGIEKWKFEAVREAILQVISSNREGVAFQDLPKLVHLQLPTNARERIGSVPWYTTTVKLEMEVRGEIKHLQGVSPQRLVRAD